MTMRWLDAGGCRWRATLAVALLAVCTLPVTAQSPAGTQAQPASAPATPAALAARQREIQDRVQRLEGTMLKLAKLLAKTEPDKAERMRDAIEHAGQYRIKSRMEQLVVLLRKEALGDADHEQARMLADLDELMKVLTSPVNEVDSRREQREKLEALKRSIRSLMEEQTQHLYRTQHAEQQRAKQSEAGAAGTPSDLQEMLRKLEQLQRQTQGKTEQVGRDMRGKQELGQPDQPGLAPLQQAAESMRRAADGLGQGNPQEAGPQQQEALEQMQESLDELDDALRQVRKEEIEETLAALEARFHHMLVRERQVRDIAAAVDAKPEAERGRTEELQLSEASETQRQVTEDCEATLRILVDEGSTVIVPELLRQLAADMADVSQRLARSDVSVTSRKVLDDIIATLEEMLGAIEKRREQNQQQDQQPQQPQGEQPDEKKQPLLPPSAELKMLRSAQVRLNERTPAAEQMQGCDPRMAEQLALLAARQQELAALALRMNERK